MWASLVFKTGHTDGEGGSESSALWRIFISYFGICASAGEFRARGSEMFSRWTAQFQLLAGILDIGFEPVVCSDVPYLMIFLAKAIAPYAMLVLVGIVLPFYLKHLELSRKRNGKPPARHDSAEDFSRLNALLFTAMGLIFIPAYCFAVP